MKAIFIILTLASLFIHLKDLNSFSKDWEKIEVNPSKPFEELFLETTFESIDKQYQNNAQFDILKIRFYQYVDSVYGSMDRANELFTFNVGLFADRFLELINLIEEDLNRSHQ